MNDQNDGRVNAQLFVLSDGTPQMLYVGKVPQDRCRVVEGVGKELQIIPDDDSGFITVYECRCIRTVLMPAPQGISISNSVMSVGMSNRAITMRIRPSMYYWAGQDDTDFDVLVKGVSACEAQEQEHRAKAAGIEIPRPRMGRLVE